MRCRDDPSRENGKSFGIGLRNLTVLRVILSFSFGKRPRGPEEFPHFGPQKIIDPHSIRLAQFLYQ